MIKRDNKNSIEFAILTISFTICSSFNYVYVCVCVYVYECTHEYRCLWGLEKVSDALQLELQGIVSHQVWMLETELRFSANAMHS